MSNVTTVNTTVDYDAIVKALTVGMRASQQANHFQKGSYWWIQEFCTIGFTMARQQGKSKYALEQLVKNDDTILIVFDSGHKRVSVANAWFTHGEHLTPDQEARIFTAIDLFRIMKGSGLAPALPKFKTIVVDDAYRFFQVRSRKGFFDWMTSLNIEDPTVLLIG